MTDAQYILDCFSVYIDQGFYSSGICVKLSRFDQDPNLSLSASFPRLTNDLADSSLLLIDVKSNRRMGKQETELDSLNIFLASSEHAVT